MPTPRSLETPTQKQIAELLLEIAVRVAFILQLDPSLSEEQVIQSARDLVAAVKTRNPNDVVRLRDAHEGGR